MKRLVVPVILGVVLWASLVLLVVPWACRQARGSVPLGIRIENTTDRNVQCYVLNFTDEQFGPVYEVSPGETIMIRGLRFNAIQDAADALLAIGVVSKDANSLTIESLHNTTIHSDSSSPFPYYYYKYREETKSPT
jgi:hypothetical protein